MNLCKKCTSLIGIQFFLLVYPVKFHQLGKSILKKVNLSTHFNRSPEGDDVNSTNGSWLNINTIPEEHRLSTCWLI